MKKKSFEYNSILLFVMMMAANGCNYVFQIVIARLLGDAGQYAVVNTLISLLSVFLIPNTLMVMVTAKYTALYEAAQEQEKRNAVLMKLRKYTVRIAVCMAGVGMCISPLIADGLKLWHVTYVWGVLIVTTVMVLSAVYVGALQGAQEFFRYGMQNLLNMLCKLFFSVLFVLLGWGVHGVLGALGVGAAAVYIYSFGYTRSYFIGTDANALENYGEIKKYIWGTLLLQVSMTFMTNGDMLLVKAFFDEAEAGIYSSAMVIGKIVLYISGAVVSTLFPMVAAEHAAGHDTRFLLKKAFLYGGGMTVLCAAVLIVSGKWMVGILFGPVYEGAVRYLPAICAYVVPLTFLTIISNFLAALGKMKLVSVSLSVCCLAAYVTALVLHQSITQMLCVIGCVMFLVFLADMIAAFGKTRCYTQERNK